MTKTPIALLFGGCVALAGCNDRASRPDLTSPTAGPTFDASATALTPLAGGDAILFPDEVGTEQVPTGGRASGHYEINPFGAFTEAISFIALSTAPFPTAKGQLEHHLTATNVTATLHAEIDCLSIVDNQAYLSGPVKKYVVNGVPVPVEQIFVRVEDNGEGGNSPPDRGSQLFIAFPRACEFRFPVPLYPSQNGNIQVKPE